jgi:hypothetical protein
VVLFDELEKAPPAIDEVLLQLIDHGEVRDSQDNLLDFSQSIIIFTTNAGVDYSGSHHWGLAKRPTDAGQPVVTRESVMRTFAQLDFGMEFFGRLEILVFRPLADAVLRVLHELNSRARAVRFSWRCWRDPANPQVEPDSGIYIRCELFIVDNKLTSLQFVEYIKALLGWYFRTGPRVQKTVETGIDPGDAPPAAPASGAAANQPIDKL